MSLRLAAILIALAGPVAAQALLPLPSREDGRSWEAVGRLEIAGAAFCTGALIDERTVLTAAHCLFDPRTGARIPASEIQFLAGWRNGRASAYRRVRRAEPHPSYAFDAPPDTTRIRNDVALITLQHPIRNTTLVPFETDVQPDEGSSVGVVSYAHDRSEAPSLQETCNVLARQEGVLVLDCSVDFGASGSPVFQFGSDGTPRIVSVVSAKAAADGAPVSLGTELQGPLSVLRRAMNSSVDPGTGGELMQAGTRRATGAKFLKP